MNTCGKCGAEHNRWRDRAQIRPAAYCKACHAAWQRAFRPKHRDLTPFQKMKANARAYANNYQRRGVLLAQPCEECGTEHAEKHHDDYLKPLHVHWLCRACHLDKHAEAA